MSNKVSKAALKAARGRKVAALADTMVEEEFTIASARLSLTKEVKKVISKMIANEDADDINYWLAPIGRKGCKSIKKALVNCALDTIGKDDDSVDWSRVPHLETDAGDDIEGIQPSFFLALAMGDKSSYADGIALVQTLASNDALVDSQGWRDGSNIAWYRVANAALLIAGEPKLLPALAAGWTPPEGESNPKAWMKALKSYATAIAGAA